MKLRCALGLFTAVMTISAGAGSSSQSEKLVNLRLKVDEKEQYLTDLRARIKGERYALETQIADLKILLGKEQVRRNTLARMEQSQKEAKRRQVEESERYFKPTIAAAEMVASQIKETIPFKKEARLSAVNEVISDLKGKKLDAGTALSRLSRIVEDELKLASEVSLHHQTIHVQDETKLAEVIRFGMAALYFRIDSEHLGRAVQSEDGTYIFEEIQHKAEKEALKGMFQAMERQIRTGTFEVLLPRMNGNK